jgi:phage recombination protein Bet
MATVVEKKDLVLVKENPVIYDINGQNITLTNAAIRQLTNNNTLITNDEIAMFVELCKYQRLNPFIKEAYLVKYDGGKPAQQVTSLGAFMRIAEEHPKYEGIEDGIIVQTADGKIADRVGCISYSGEVLLGGWAKVYRADRKIPSVARLSLKEYTKGQATWNSSPATMINKCAKVSALRKAFPKALNGLYEEDELKSADVIPQMPTPQNKEYDIDETEPTVEGDIFMEDEQMENEIIAEVLPQIEKDNEIKRQAEKTKEIVKPQEPKVEPKKVTVVTAVEEKGILILPYKEYTENKEKYEKVDYPDGRKAYNTTEKTIRVKIKE